MKPSKQKEVGSASLINFKASSNLTKTIKAERKATDNSFLKIKAGKEHLEALKSSGGTKKSTTSLSRKKDDKNIIFSSRQVEGQVKSLANVPEMKTSEKGVAMIKSQRERRREAHKNELIRHERWMDQFEENLEEQLKEINDTLKLYLSASNSELIDLLETLAAEGIHLKNVEVFRAVREQTEVHHNERRTEIEKFYRNLQNLENTRLKQVTTAVSKLRANLIEHAFILEPQVDELLQSFKDEIKAKVDDNLVVRHQAYELELANNEEEMERFYDHWKQKEQRWKRLKHDYAVEQFKLQLNSSYFVNPPKRVECFKALYRDQSKVFEQRTEFVNELRKLPMQELSKVKIETLIEAIKELNDKCQEIYDVHIETIRDTQQIYNDEADNLLEDLQNELEVIEAILNEGDSIERVIDEECKVLVEARKTEATRLMSDAIKFLEDTDLKAHDACVNLANFYKTVGEKLDAFNKEKNDMEHKFRIDISKRADQSDETLDQYEDSLKQSIHEMSRSIHHMVLDERLQTCFKTLDDIADEYRDFANDHRDVAEAHPQLIQDCFLKIQNDVAGCLRMVNADKRDELMEEIRQKLFEEKKQEMIHEAELAAQKEAEESKNQKGKRAAGKPKPIEIKDEDVHIEVPELDDYGSPFGNEFVLPKPMSDLVDYLLNHNSEEDEQGEKKEGEENGKNEVEEVEAAKKAEEEAENPDEEDKDEKEDPTASSPEDPEGNSCLNSDVVFLPEFFTSTVVDFRTKVMEYLYQVYSNHYETQMKLDKDELDDIMEELDERLRKHWPRKGRLEVDYYQVRAAEITGHKQRYERHVRSVCEKNEFDRERFVILVENYEETEKEFLEEQEEFKDALPNAKNLGELQGVQRRVKESLRVFSEKSNGLMEQLNEVSTDNTENLLQQNRTFIKNCTLFENGGNFDQEEVEWYENMLKDIDKEFTEDKEKREAQVKECEEKYEKVKHEPFEIFQKAYANSVETLAAREGMGKKYGAPRRGAQEKMRAEMTKVEKAQEGVENLMTRLRELVQEFEDNSGDKMYFFKRTKPLSGETRFTLLSLRSCMHKLAHHLNSFREGAKSDALPRLTLEENSENLELNEEETAIDQQRFVDELEPIGLLGVINHPQNKFSFKEAVNDIERVSRDQCARLYAEGIIAKSVPLIDKIPEFMKNYLEDMQRNAEEFRIKSVGSLRQSCEEMLVLAESLPQVVFGSMIQCCQADLENQCDFIEAEFHEEDDRMNAEKNTSMKSLRPNLENPSCYDELQELCSHEDARSKRFCEFILKTKKDLLNLEKTLSADFFKRLLNNTQLLLQVYDFFFIRADFIMLPGDDQVEKKHTNIKRLMRRRDNKSEEVSSDIPRSIIKKWAQFRVDSFSVKRKQSTDGEGNEGEEAPEMTREMSSFKSPYHKAVIACRNATFDQFKSRFNNSIQRINDKYEHYSREEKRFILNWINSSDELKQKNQKDVHK